MGLKPISKDWTNIKLTVYTETNYVLKCFELNLKEIEIIGRNTKYVSALFNKDIENGKKELALFIMTTCENMDRNIINIENDKMEVWLSNKEWAYFENFECKGKEFENSQLAVTVWILQDSKVW